jgi:hypothetical protein
VNQSPTEQATTSAPEQTTAPAPENPVAFAQAAFRDVLAEAIANGEISEKDAAHIVDESQKAIDEADRGDLDKAVDRLDKLTDSIQGLYDHGRIASEERALLLANAVTSLRDALIATTPIDEAVDQGDGKAKGHGKDEDKGKDH